MEEALGLLETKGFTALAEGTDAMAKAARVQIVGYKEVGYGLVTTIIRGDVASVKTAVEAGASAAGKIGELVAVHVIAHPAPGLEAAFSIPPKKES